MPGRREIADRVRRERGERLRIQRRSVKGLRGKRMTQRELGMLVDITAQQISKYEKGTDLVSAGWAHRFAGVLGCSFRTLYVGDLFELAEPRASFHHARNEDDRLGDILALAAERLTHEGRMIVRNVILELLDEHETGAEPPAAP